MVIVSQDDFRRVILLDQFSYSGFDAVKKSCHDLWSNGRISCAIAHLTYWRLWVFFFFFFAVTIKRTQQTRLCTQKICRGFQTNVWDYPSEKRRSVLLNVVACASRMTLTLSRDLSFLPHSNALVPELCARASLIPCDKPIVSKRSASVQNVAPKVSARI